MSEALSPNTQAILLLTAPLLAGRSTQTADVLKPSEYKKLAKYLLRIGSEPADLLAPEAGRIRESCHGIVDKDRIKRLLDRGFLLGQVVERWQTRAIWVVSRADAAYPRRLKDRLKEDSPAVLYGCGAKQLLNTGGLAVVGSRNVEEKLIKLTQGVGRLAAKAGQTLISGGARGVDQAAMQGASEAGGKVVGVLADSLERSALKREHRKFLMHDQLVLVSPYDPSAKFNVGHAMQRNKLIYALADAALVMNADLGTGGTWAGAVEQLEKLRFVRVYVRSTGPESEGLNALRTKGACPWPNPEEANALVAALRIEEFNNRGSSVQTTLPFSYLPAAATTDQVRDASSSAEEGTRRFTEGQDDPSD